MSANLEVCHSRVSAVQMLLQHLVTALHRESISYLIAGFPMKLCNKNEGVFGKANSGMTSLAGSAH